MGAIRFLMGMFVGLSMVATVAGAHSPQDFIKKPSAQAPEVAVCADGDLAVLIRGAKLPQADKAILAAKRLAATEQPAVEDTTQFFNFFEGKPLELFEVVAALSTSTSGLNAEQIKTIVKRYYEFLSVGQRSQALKASIKFYSNLASQLSALYAAADDTELAAVLAKVLQTARLSHVTAAGLNLLIADPKHKLRLPESVRAKVQAEVDREVEGSQVSFVPGDAANACALDGAEFVGRASELGLDASKVDGEKVAKWLQTLNSEKEGTPAHDKAFTQLVSALSSGRMTTDDMDVLAGGMGYSWLKPARDLAGLSPEQMASRTQSILEAAKKGGVDPEKLRPVLTSLAAGTDFQKQHEMEQILALASLDPKLREENGGLDLVNRTVKDLKQFGSRGAVDAPWKKTADNLRTFAMGNDSVLQTLKHLVEKSYFSGTREAYMKKLVAEIEVARQAGRPVGSAPSTTAASKPTTGQTATQQTATTAPAETSQNQPAKTKSTAQAPSQNPFTVAANLVRDFATRLGVGTTAPTSAQPTGQKATQPATKENPPAAGAPAPIPVEPFKEGMPLTAGEQALLQASFPTVAFWNNGMANARLDAFMNAIELMSPDQKAPTEAAQILAHMMGTLTAEQREAAAAAASEDLKDAEKMKNPRHKWLAKALIYAAGLSTGEDTTEMAKDPLFQGFKEAFDVEWKNNRENNASLFYTWIDQVKKNPQNMDAVAKLQNNFDPESLVTWIAHQEKNGGKYVEHASILRGALGRDAEGKDQGIQVATSVDASNAQLKNLTTKDQLAEAVSAARTRGTHVGYVPRVALQKGQPEPRVLEPVVATTEPPPIQPLPAQPLPAQQAAVANPVLVEQGLAKCATCHSGEGTGGFAMGEDFGLESLGSVGQKLRQKWMNANGTFKPGKQAALKRMLGNAQGNDEALSDEEISELTKFLSQR